MSLSFALPPLTGGGFWVAFAQVALVYYGFAAAIHWAIPRLFEVESVQVGKRRPGQVKKEALLSIGERAVFSPPPSPRPFFFYSFSTSGLFFFFFDCFLPFVSPSSSPCERTNARAGKRARSLNSFSFHSMRERERERERGREGGKDEQRPRRLSFNNKNEKLENHH